MHIDDRTVFFGRLEALRVAYGAALPDQLGLLRAAARGLNVVRSRNDTCAGLEEIRVAAHKFAGSAPTFGFNEVGDGARALERMVGSILQAAGPLTVDDVAAIQEAIEALIADARRAVTACAAANTIVLVMEVVAPEAPLAELLQRAGYAPVVVGPDTDMRAVLAGGAPRAILVQADSGTDLVLSLLDRVRAAGCAAVPVVFCAGHGNFAARYAASRAGAVGFLADPLRMPDLPDRLAALIAPVSFQPYRVLYIGVEAPALDPTIFQLRAESDPTALLRRIEDTRPELLLLSTELEDFDAVDLARMIWQEEAHWEIGIFFLSRDPALHRAVAARGVTDAYFISRPADVVAVQGRITPYLHDRRAGLRPSNQVDLGPHLGRIAGHTGAALTIRAPEPAGQSGNRRRKILIVDDDRYLVAMLAHALTDSGAEVVRAYSGDQGYAAAWQELPSVIISDVEMPNGTGDQMIQQLRGNPRTRDIPVIVMTNRRWEDGKDYALERDMRGRLGASAYLQKPVRAETLVRELARL